MTNFLRAKPSRILLTLAILMGPCLVPSTAQQPAAPDRRQLENIERRLERIEESLRRLEPRSEGAGVQTRAAAAVDRRPRDARFRLPQGVRVRAISTANPPAGPGPAAGTDLDSDSDDLTDAEEEQVGTNPQDRDTDGDALWDGWEVHTIDGLDLRSLGASPLHKDIFVEMDFMRRDTATNGLGPSDTVLRGIEAVFAAAPVQNPDGRPGIDIHLVMGNEVPYDADLSPYFTEFARLRNTHFEAKRARAFHYMIWANGYSGGTSSGISMDIPHSEFIVTLGRWNSNRGGTDAQKIGTFVHELGHNLGRKHGGSDHRNFKANHLSVMNYHFQMQGVLRNGTRAFDYQSFTLPSLSEGSLRESDGLGGAPALAGYSTIYRTSSGNGTRLKEVACHAAVDWNDNGAIDQTSIRFDLDQDTLFGDMLETPNEWAALVFNGGVLGERFPVAGIFALSSAEYEELPVEELTEELYRTIESQLR